MQDHILRKKIVREQTSLSNTQIDTMEKNGDFPRRRQITQRIVGWSYNEIQNWINDRLHNKESRLRANTIEPNEVSK